jgi:hypothetical protein
MGWPSLISVGVWRQSLEGGSKMFSTGRMHLAIIRVDSCSQMGGTVNQKH